VGVWVELDLVKDGGFDALVGVLGVSDHSWMLFHVVALVWVPPKEWARPSIEAMQRRSRYGR
jgi:hypothetical protein